MLKICKILMENKDVDSNFFDGVIEIVEKSEASLDNTFNNQSESQCIVFTNITAEEGVPWKGNDNADVNLTKNKFANSENNKKSQIQIIDSNSYFEIINEVEEQEVSQSITEIQETQINLDSQYINDLNKSIDSLDNLKITQNEEISAHEADDCTVQLAFQESSEMLFNSGDKIDLINDVLNEIGESSANNKSQIANKNCDKNIIYPLTEELSADQSIFTEPLSLEIRDSVVENKKFSQSISGLSDDESVIEMNQTNENSSYIDNEKLEKIAEMLNGVSLDQDELCPEEINELCLTFSKKMKFNYTIHDYKSMAPIFKKQLLQINFRNKSHILQEFCKRWWYVLPEWPPQDYDYSDKLRKLKLKEVPIEQWMETPDCGKDITEKKVLKVKNYPGIFEDAKGQLYDLRPQETCPSIRNFSKIEPIQLMNLLMEAYTSQLSELNSLEQYEVENEKIHKDRLMLYEYLLNKLTKTLEDPPKEFILA